MRSLWSRDPAPLTGTIVGVGLVVTITAALVPVRVDVSRATPSLVLLMPVVLAGIVGGRVSAAAAVVAAALAFDLAFIPPFWTLRIDLVDDAVALGLFTIVGLVVGMLIAREAGRRRLAEQRAVTLQRLNDRYETMQSERERLAEETARQAVLDQVGAQRAALLRSVSHDLRTPLAAIQAVASDLRAEAGYDDATRHELLDLAIDQSERLDRVVGNLLTMSRLEAGGIELDRQAVALEELVTDCARRLDRLFQRIELDVHIPDRLPLADADYSQLDQVVTNLLENAARHAPAGSTVRISAAQTRDGRLTVLVEDQGPGVPPAERDRIFEPFRRSQAGRSTDVGLAVCKAIIEAHGGTIRVEDAPRRGARFVFTLTATP